MIDDKSKFAELTVLIVDDDMFMCRMVGELCQSIGFKKVIRTSQPDDVLGILKCNHVDVMVCDLLMHPIDGLGVTKLVRRSPESPNAALPIVMLTGYAEVSRVREARDAGVTAFITKPVSRKTLALRLTQALNDPRPFVRCDVYVGPCRRHRIAEYEGPDRRTTAPDEPSNADAPEQTNEQPANEAAQQPAEAQAAAG